MNDIRRANNIIFDIGMHTGEDTAFYLAKGFRVVAVDASVALVRAGEARFAEQIKAGLLTIRHAAIARERGIVQFHVHATEPQWSSLFPDRHPGDRHQTVSVPAMGLDDVIAEHGTPYYCKIDIEGADGIALDTLARCRERPQYISVEYSGPTHVDQLLSLDYKRFLLVDQHVVQANQGLTERQFEGNRINWTFGLASSGPFGRDLPDESWTDAETAKSEFFRLWDQGRNKRFTYDVHASLA